LNRAHFAARLVSVTLLLLTAGCFRPAGESIAPTVGAALPLESPNLQLSPTEPIPTSADVSETEQATSDIATLPVITLITPEDEATPESDVTLDLGNLQSLATEEVTSFPTLVAATSTPRFITPGSPLGPVTPDTVTPTLNAPPTSTPSGLITPTSLPGTEDDECSYVVQPGDNLYSIATGRGLTVDDMLNANPDLEGDPPILQVGQVLQLPDCESDSVQPNPQATVSGVATTAPVPPAGTEVYIVQPGDTLYAIALRFGITVQAIIDANELPNPDRLDVGQQLIIPTG
jgi:LysM repeat protein